MKIVKTILISAATTFIGFYLMYSYLPLSLIEKEVEPVLGASITTILGSDTLSASRSVINTNFANLNSDKLETSATSSDNITNLPNLVEVGALAGGSLTTGFTPVPVALNGTGTTTPTDGAVMIGDGASGLTTIGFGTNGQFLTSGGDGVDPSWTTSSIDEAGSYTWTGPHVWNTASTTFNVLAYFNDETTMATTTISDLTVTGTATGSFPIYYAASSSQLQLSADTQNDHASADITSYTKSKEIQFYMAGVVVTKFGLKTDNASYSVTARIYVNGIAVGTERTTTSTSFVTYTENIDVDPADLVQIYVKVASNDGQTLSLNNFRFYFDKMTADNGGNVLID